MEKQPMEYYRDVAIQICRVKYEGFKLLKMLGNHTPKGVWQKSTNKLLNGIDQLRSDLENRMFKDYPAEASAYMFYSIDIELWEQFKNVDDAFSPYFEHPNWNYSEGRHEPTKMEKERLRTEKRDKEI